MAALARDALIVRHLEKLRSRPRQRQDPAAPVARAGLLVVGGRITHGDSPVTPSDCHTYKRAVRDVYGDATYAFTNVNFVLGGCTCAECGSWSPIVQTRELPLQVRRHSESDLLRPPKRVGGHHQFPAGSISAQ